MQVTSNILTYFNDKRLPRCYHGRSTFSLRRKVSILVFWRRSNIFQEVQVILYQLSSLRASHCNASTWNVKSLRPFCHKLWTRVSLSSPLAKKRKSAAVILASFPWIETQDMLKAVLTEHKRPGQFWESVSQFCRKYALHTIVNQKHAWCFLFYRDLSLVAPRHFKYPFARKSKTICILALPVTTGTVDALAKIGQHSKKR